MNPAEVLIAGRADGQIHSDIDVLELETFTSRRIGQTVIQTTTAPLIEVAPHEWWLIGGEPDSNKTRADRVSVIRRSADREGLGDGPGSNLSSRTVRR